MNKIKLLIAVSMACTLAACASDAAPSSNRMHKMTVERDCEQFYAHIADKMERGGKVKACMRARGGL